MTLTYILPERPFSDRRLGRHIEHDPLSRAYELDTSELSIQPVLHVRQVPILDQGNLGCCTGCAMTGALGTEPFYDTLPSGVQCDLDLAHELYSRATHLDSVPGVWPTDDTGSTGVAVAKAARAKGLLSGYLHTFSLDAALKALSVTPVITGIGWYDSFDEPDATGLISISPDATVRGGHEIVADEVAVNGATIWIGFSNSWGTGFGVAGRFYMSADTLGRLLHENGDVTVPVPVTVPPPQPKPPAPASPDDLNLWVAAKAWAKAKGLA